MTSSRPLAIQCASLFLGANHRLSNEAFNPGDWLAESNAWHGQVSAFSEKGNISLEGPRGFWGISGLRADPVPGGRPGGASWTLQPSQTLASLRFVLEGRRGPFFCADFVWGGPQACRGHATHGPSRCV